MLVHRESRIYRSDHTAADLTVRVCVYVMERYTAVRSGKAVLRRSR